MTRTNKQTNNKTEVGTLQDALGLLAEFRGRYPGHDIMSFLIAPLRTTNGGQRSWHALRNAVEDDDNTAQWVPEKEVGAYAPVLGEATYPALPDSPINRWAFVFVGSAKDDPKETAIIANRMPSSVTRRPRHSVNSARQPCRL